MITYLDWDSNLFGYRIGRATIRKNESNSKLIKSIYYEAKEKSYKLVYIFSEEELIDNSTIITLADVKITFKREINSFKYNIPLEISLYESNEVTEDLFALAIHSGQYSRFKTDLNFKNNEFDLLYTEWIKNSVNKKIADQVIVFSVNHKIVGLLTLAFKRENSEIGILAVDDKFQGLGIGSQLINSSLLNTFKGKGLSEIKVATQLRNKKAYTFYIKNQFLCHKKEFIYHLWI